VIFVVDVFAAIRLLRITDAQYDCEILLEIREP
jgi:hypothetical protein